MDPRKDSLNGWMVLLVTTVTGTGASLVMASIQTQKKTVCRCGTHPVVVGTLGPELSQSCWRDTMGDGESLHPLKNGGYSEEWSHHEACGGIREHGEAPGIGLAH